jgi:hypothetical protein
MLLRIMIKGGSATGSYGGLVAAEVDRRRYHLELVVAGADIPSVVELPG